MKWLGIDIGTTSIAAVVIEGETGKVVRCTSAVHAADLAGEESWERLQDPSVLTDVAMRLMAEVAHDVPDIGGIGISGQMHGILYVDASGGAVSPLYTWQDGRAAVASPSGHTFAQWFAHRTGHPAASGWGLVTHAALMTSGGVPEGAVALCTIGDYLALRLTGRIRPLQHATQAASLGLWTGHAFAADALARVQVSPDWLPDVLSVGQYASVGHTPDGVAVYTAIGDNQASFLGSVTEPVGTLCVNIGTGAQVSLWLPDDRCASIDGFECRPFIDGSVLLVGVTLSGGRAYALLETFFQRVLTLFGPPSQPQASLYAAMSEALARWPGTDEPLQVRTQFAGTRSDPSARGVIAGLSEHNFLPEPLIDGVVRGMAQELRDLVDSLPAEIRQTITRLLGAGNGIRRNPHLAHAVAQTFGLSLSVSAHEEEAARGAALYAGIAAGYYPDAATAMRLSMTERA
ncbi:MAG: FGGY family carbohydrate kinase [Firmicutes bacterium]|nr:FGGY family carbohydrate kinase [Bacillota bacterium]